MPKDMKLLTKEVLDAFEKQGDTSKMKPEDTKIIAKFFNAGGPGRWYATEYDPRTRTFFGFVSIFNDHCDELGSFTLDELESVVGSFGLGIERDKYFGEHNLQEILDGKRP